MKVINVRKVYRIITAQNIINTLITVCWNMFTHKTFIYKVKGVFIFMYLLNAALNCAFHVERRVRLYGEPLKIMLPGYNILS